MCSLAPSNLQNLTVQALCCAGNGAPPGMQCAICPNQDLAGIGVRLAFYIQSFLGAALIVFSPADSSATTWACTLLTTALIIAGFVAKAQGNLTLHHAVLVLNFATLSAISSLAVAPMLSIWRLSPAEYCEEQERRYAILHIDRTATTREGVIMNSLHRTITKNPKNKKRAKQAQMRARLVLSMALILQVVLQWAWGIFLFVSPNYAQSDCSGSTILVLFMHSFATGTINDLDQAHARFLIWPAWILFSLGITLFLAAYLAGVGSAYSQDSHSTPATALSSMTPIVKQWGNVVLETLPSSVRDFDYGALLVRLVMIGLWALYITTSEYQIQKNNIFPGENSLGGVGQIVALIASGAPLWSLCYALYKYPIRRRKLMHYQALSASSDSVGQDHEQGGAQSVSLLAVPPTPWREPSQQSDASYASGESIELRQFPLPGGLVAEPFAFPVLPYNSTPSSSAAPPRWPVVETEARVAGDSLYVPMRGVSQRLRGPRPAPSGSWNRDIDSSVGT